MLYLLPSKTEFIFYNMIQNPAIDSIEMNIKSKMWKRQAGRAVSKSQSVRKTLRKIETERSQCSSS